MTDARMIEIFDTLMSKLPCVGRPQGHLRLLGTFPPEPTRSLACDILLFDLFYEDSTNQLWLRVSGGILGQSRWYGPLDEGEERARTLLARLSQLK